jgi:hypothetical protein
MRTPRPAALTLAATGLLSVTLAVGSAPAQADSPGPSETSASDKSALLKNFINDIGLHLITEKGILFFEDLKKSEQTPAASN